MPPAQLSTLPVAELASLPVVPLQRLADLPRPAALTLTAETVGGRRDDRVELTPPAPWDRCFAVGTDHPDPVVQRLDSFNDSPGPVGKPGVVQRDGPRPSRGRAPLIGMARARPRPETTLPVVTVSEPQADSGTGAALDEQPASTDVVEVRATATQPDPGVNVAGSGHAITTSGGATAPGATPDPSQIDELARQLFDPLMLRLRAELLVDRERRGLRTDRW